MDFAFLYKRFLEFPKLINAGNEHKFGNLKMVLTPSPMEMTRALVPVNYKITVCDDLSQKSKLISETPYHYVFECKIESIQMTLLQRLIDSRMGIGVFYQYRPTTGPIFLGLLYKLSKGPAWSNGSPHIHVLKPVEADCRRDSYGRVVNSIESTREHMIRDQIVAYRSGQRRDIVSRNNTDF